MFDTHYFALGRVILFHFDVFIVYIIYSYFDDSWFLLKFWKDIEKSRKRKKKSTKKYQVFQYHRASTF